MSRARDPRPARTRAAVFRAVEALGARGDEITVARIVSEAGIGRATFYDHFRDLDAVAVAVVTEAFVEIEHLDLRLRGDATPRETARATTDRLVAEFARRRSLYAGVLGSRTSVEAYRAFHDAFAEQALETMRRAAPPGVDPEIAARYLAGGSIAVLAEWLLTEAPPPPEEIQRHLVALLPAWLLSDDGHHERNIT